MTKDEMLELLGDMDPQYILEGQRLRSGQMHTRNKGSWLRRATAVAAMLAVVTVAGVLLKPCLSASWVRPGVEEEQENQPENTKTIRYYLDGEEVQTEATLFEAEEFSIYIFPDWAYETITYGSNQAHRWTKGTSALTVLYRQEETMAAVREWVRLKELSKPFGNGSYGSLRTNGMYVYFTEASGGWLVQILEFSPQGDADDSVRTMEAMRDTLVPAENAPQSTSERPKVVDYSLQDETFVYQSVTFTLYQGDGWSTYIPEGEDWQPVDPDYLKIDTPQMEAVLCLENQGHRFTVLRLENATADEAINWTSEAYPAHGWDWEWTPKNWDQDSDSFSCTASNEEMRTVKKRFIRYQDGFYVVISDYYPTLLKNYVRIMDAEFLLDIP